MLDLVFALMLAGAGLNDPGIASPGLDDRPPASPATVQLAGSGGGGGRGDGPPAQGRSAVTGGEWDVVDIVITEAERRIFEDYFGRNPCELRRCDGKGNLPPGLEKKRSLPPGLAKQLVRNGRLPAGLDRRALPEALVRRLPPRPAGYRYVMVDDRILLVERATDVILDALDIVLDGDG